MYLALVLITGQPACPVISDFPKPLCAVIWEQLGESCMLGPRLPVQVVGVMLLLEGGAFEIAGLQLLF